MAKNDQQTRDDGRESQRDVDSDLPDPSPNETLRRWIMRVFEKMNDQWHERERLRIELCLPPPRRHALRRGMAWGGFSVAGVLFATCARARGWWP